MSRDDPALQPFRVQLVDFTATLAELRAVRDEVFVGEQRVPVELEHDALDPLCTHALARLLDGTPIGAARLTPERHIGRMAVRAPWRGRGVGDALLLALVDEARKRGWPEVRLNSQASAIGFYERHGFAPEGERFIEAGIEHQAMRCALAGPQRIDTREAAIEAAIRAIDGARRRVWIRSFDLEAWLFADADLVQALRRFATSGRGNEVRVLLHDAAAPQAAHAKLLELAQRLPSVFQFREVDDPVYREERVALVANDAGGYYVRTQGDRVEGVAAFDSRARVRQLQQRFEEIWERSRPVTEYRALGI